MSPRTTSLVTSARREAILCGVIFVCAISYSITTCVRMGYSPPGEKEMTYVLGFPDWVFHGIMIPWAICTVIAWLFSFVIMQDVDLGDAAPASDDSEFLSETVASE